MTPADLDALVRRLLGDIAPDMDPDSLGPDDDVRDALDIDSVDFLNFVVALHETTGVDVPEQDYRSIRTVSACVAYLSAALAARP
jgi:acyl carrier protein